MRHTKSKLAFAGTPEISAVVLRDLIANNINIIAALTQPDRPKGRGKKLASSSVKLLSQEHNIPVYQPINLKDQDIINKRWEICSGCEFLTGMNRCEKCGCFMKVKTRISEASCPISSLNLSVRGSRSSPFI